MNIKKNQGVTIVEMMVSVAILGTVVLLGRVGVLLMNNVLQTSAVSKVQQEAQLVLYTITKDVRNSIRIVQASSGTLTLNMLNTTPGFDLVSNPQIFNEVNITTLTYSYVSVNNETYLRKTLTRNNTLVEDKKMMRNMLLPWDASNYLFNVCSRVGINSLDRCPLPGETNYPDPPGELPNPDGYYGVDIRFRMSPLFVKKSDVLYAVREIRRSKVE